MCCNSNTRTALHKIHGISKGKMLQQTSLWTPNLKYFPIKMTCLKTECSKWHFKLQLWSKTVKRKNSETMHTSWLVSRHILWLSGHLPILLRWRQSKLLKIATRVLISRFSADMIIVKMITMTGTENLQINTGSKPWRKTGIPHALWFDCEVRDMKGTQNGLVLNLTHLHVIVKPHAFW